MSNEALDVDFHCFLYIAQRLGLCFALAVASSQGGTERMITANGFFLHAGGANLPGLKSSTFIDRAVFAPHSSIFLLNS